MNTKLSLKTLNKSAFQVLSTSSLRDDMHGYVGLLLVSTWCFQCLLLFGVSFCIYVTSDMIKRKTEYGVSHEVVLGAQFSPAMKEIVASLRLKSFS